MLGHPFHSPLDKGNRLETIVCICSVGSSGMEDSAGLFWECFGGNKETQGTYHYAVPQVPTSLESPPSFHLSDILDWYVVL